MDYTQVANLNNTNFLPKQFAMFSIILASITIADARPLTTNLTCSQVQSMVRSQRSILLSTGKYTYDRYVISGTYCPYGDFAKNAYVQTRDRKSCRIGYTCTIDNPLEFLND